MVGKTKKRSPETGWSYAVEISFRFASIPHPVFETVHVDESRLPEIRAKLAGLKVATPTLEFHVRKRRKRSYEVPVDVDSIASHVLVLRYRSTGDNSLGPDVIPIRPFTEPRIADVLGALSRGSILDYEIAECRENLVRTVGGLDAVLDMVEKHLNSRRGATKAGQHSPYQDIEDEIIKEIQRSKVESRNRPMKLSADALTKCLREKRSNLHLPDISEETFGRWRRKFIKDGFLFTPKNSD